MTTSMMMMVMMINTEVTLMYTLKIFMTIIPITIITMMLMKMMIITIIGLLKTDVTS